MRAYACNACAVCSVRYSTHTLNKCTCMYILNVRHVVKVLDVIYVDKLVWYVVCNVCNVLRKIVCNASAM